MENTILILSKILIYIFSSRKLLNIKFKKIFSQNKTLWALIGLLML